MEEIKSKKILFFLLCLVILSGTSAKQCTSQVDCGNALYYTCKQNNCCKKAGLSCGAGYSWSCCNRCVVPKYHITGTCS